MEMLACTGVYLYFAPMRSTLHECLKRWGKFGCGDVYVSPGPMDVYEGCIASSWDTGVWGALPLMRSTMSWDTGVWGALPLMRSTINECLEVGWGKCGCGDIYLYPWAPWKSLLPHTCNHMLVWHSARSSFPDQNHFEMPENSVILHLCYHGWILQLMPFKLISVIGIYKLYQTYKCYWNINIYIYISIYTYIYIYKLYQNIKQRHII